MFQNTANQDLMFARYENAIYIYIYIYMRTLILSNKTLIISSLFHEITFQFTPPLNQLLVYVYTCILQMQLRILQRLPVTAFSTYACASEFCHYSKVTSTCPVAWLLFQSHCWRRYYLGYFMTLHTCCAFCFHIPNEWSSLQTSKSSYTCSYCKIYYTVVL